MLGNSSLGLISSFILSKDVPKLGILFSRKVE